MDHIQIQRGFADELSKLAYELNARFEVPENDVDNSDGGGSDRLSI